MAARTRLQLVNAALAIAAALVALALFGSAAWSGAKELTLPVPDREIEARRAMRLDALREDAWDRLCAHGYVPSGQDGYTYR